MVLNAYIQTNVRDVTWDIPSSIGNVRWNKNATAIEDVYFRANSEDANPVLFADSGDLKLPYYNSPGDFGVIVQALAGDEFRFVQDKLEVYSANLRPNLFGQNTPPLFKLELLACVPLELKYERTVECVSPDLAYNLRNVTEAFLNLYRAVAAKSATGKPMAEAIYRAACNSRFANMLDFGAVFGKDLAARLQKI